MSKQHFIEILVKVIKMAKKLKNSGWVQNTKDYNRYFREHGDFSNPIAAFATLTGYGLGFLPYQSIKGWQYIASQMKTNSRNAVTKNLRSIIKIQKSFDGTDPIYAYDSTIVPAAGKNWKSITFISLSTRLGLIASTVDKATPQVDHYSWEGVLTSQYNGTVYPVLVTLDGGASYSHTDGTLLPGSLTSIMEDIVTGEHRYTFLDPIILDKIDDGEYFRAKFSLELTNLAKGVMQNINAAEYSGDDVPITDIILIWMSPKTASTLYLRGFERYTWHSE
jgi:hypothetical protein